MTPPSTSPAPHLPSWELAPRPFDCDLLGSAKTGGLEMADDTLGFDLVLARFRKQQLQPALRQDTVSLSATPPIAGPALCRSSHPVLDLAEDGTTLLTPTSMRLDKTKGGDDDAADASASVLGLAGDGATPMARTSTRVDKIGLLGADDGVVLARVLGFAGDGHGQLGRNVDAGEQDLGRRGAGGSGAPRAWSPREMAILVQTLAPLQWHHPGWHHPVSALDGRVFARSACGLLAMTSTRRAKTTPSRRPQRFPAAAWVSRSRRPRGFPQDSNPPMAPTVAPTRSVPRHRRPVSPEAATTQRAPEPPRSAEAVDPEAAMTARPTTKRRRRPGLPFPLDKAGNVGDSRRAFRWRGNRV